MPWISVILDVPPKTWGSCRLYIYVEALQCMLFLSCKQCIAYMKGTGIELCYMAVLPHDSSYFWRCVNAKVKVKIGNKVEPRSFQSSFIKNPTRSHLITQPALVLTRCLWPSPTKRWWQRATLLPLLEESPTSLFQSVQTAHRWFKGFELLNTSVLDKMLNTLADQCTLQVNRETTGWCQHHKLQNSIQGNIYNQGFSSVSSNNQRIT